MVHTIERSNRCPEPVISVWEDTGVRSSGSSHSSIWVWTSTWESILFDHKIKGCVIFTRLSYTRSFQDPVIHQ